MTHDSNDSGNDIAGEEPNEFTRLLPDSNWLEQTIPSLFVNDPELLDGPPSFKPPDSLVEQFKENSVKPAVPVSSKEFAAIIKDCIAAIKAGVYPTRITKGSSGSYFCKNTQGQVVGVFKPSSEEPYGNLNPKWTKWLHRNLLPCCFGREGIIPAVGYLSEAGASLIDRRLGLNVVPRTEIVRLASPTFHYTFKQRWAYRLFDRPLPLKTGSFQLFLNGFTDATTFFNEGFAALQNQQESRWDEDAQKQFQYGFERLTILDYLIRNTDRGSDNWMIKYTPREDAIENEVPDFEKDDSRIFSGGSSSKAEAATVRESDQELSMNVAKITLVKKSDVSIGAIDNGLAFPTKHPNNFRSYPYAWISLPIVHTPFSADSAQFFLPYLTSATWWDITIRDLERLFALDQGFKPSVFAKQKALIRGQGHNIVDILAQSRIHPTSPIDMVRKPMIMIHEDAEVGPRQTVKHRIETFTRKACFTDC